MITVIKNQRFGSRTVLECQIRRQGQKTKYPCNCSVRKETYSDQLRIGRHASCGCIPKGHQADHIFSALVGFRKGIQSKVISHPNNLQLLPESENKKKNSDCWMT